MYSYRLEFWKFPVLISAATFVITEVLCSFSQFLEADAGIVPRLGHYYSYASSADVRGVRKDWNQFIHCLCHFNVEVKN
jgi:hypothetical protein